MKTYGDYLMDRMLHEQQRWANLDELTYRSLGSDGWSATERAAKEAWHAFLRAQAECNRHATSQRRHARLR